MSKEFSGGSEWCAGIWTSGKTKGYVADPIHFANMLMAKSERYKSNAYVESICSEQIEPEILVLAQTISEVKEQVVEAIQNRYRS